MPRQPNPAILHKGPSYFSTQGKPRHSLAVSASKIAVMPNGVVSVVCSSRRGRDDARYRALSRESLFSHLSNHNAGSLQPRKYDNARSR
jgi:hypothetical protein